MRSIGSSTGTTGVVATGAGGTAGAFGAAGTSAAGAAGLVATGAAGVVTADGGRTGAIGFGGITGAAGAVARGDASGACCFSRMAFNASPGFEMCEKSNFGFNPSSAAFRAADLCPPSPPWRKCAFTLSASSTLIELECVFFSVTPTCGSTSRMALLLTSNSLAKSLIRTLSTIRPRFCSANPLSSHVNLTVKRLLPCVGNLHSSRSGVFC
jgi:hypothetical protein